MHHGHYPGYRANHKCREIPLTPTPVSLSKPLVICLHCRCPALSLVILLGPRQSMKRLAPCHAVPRAPGVLLSSVHHPALIHCFRPLSRVTTCTSFYLQLKAFGTEGKAVCFAPCSLMSQKHVASHLAGASELPGGQTSNVNGHVPLNRSHSVQHILVALRAYAD